MFLTYAMVYRSEYLLSIIHDGYSAMLGGEAKMQVGSRPDNRVMYTKNCRISINCHEL